MTTIKLIFTFLFDSSQLRKTSSIGSVSLKTNELMSLLPVVSKMTRQYCSWWYIYFGLFHCYYDQKDTVKSKYEPFRPDELTFVRPLGHFDPKLIFYICILKIMGWSWSKITFVTLALGIHTKHFFKWVQLKKHQKFFKSYQSVIHKTFTFTHKRLVMFCKVLHFLTNLEVHSQN